MIESYLRAMLTNTACLSILLFVSFPGGESYRDLMRRLASVVIDVEQQVIPTLVVSHVSILQCLMSYFRNSPVEQCMSIEVPMHTVIKFTPVRGGGWSESMHPLFEDGTVGIGMRPVESISEVSAMSDTENSDVMPIWGDYHPPRGLGRK
jgi:broad specificity phosphatase PhoE